MLHIYRQIASLRRVRPVVVAQKLENEERFPFQDIWVVRKPAWHFLRRIWFKQIVDQPSTGNHGNCIANHRCHVSFKVLLI